MDGSSNNLDQQVRRRSVAKTAAWSVPVIATGAVLPAASASGCTGPDAARITKEANATTGTQQQVTVPACAKKMTFFVLGGAGGLRGGGTVTGSVAVTPGQIVYLYPGGYGSPVQPTFTNSPGGTSFFYGSTGGGGMGTGACGGGGAASALYVDNTLIAVGGGSGGTGQVSVTNGANEPASGNYNNGTGAGGSASGNGDKGPEVFLAASRNGTQYAGARGGRGATTTAVGAGGDTYGPVGPNLAGSSYTTANGGVGGSTGGGGAHGGNGAARNSEGFGGAGGGGGYYGGGGGGNVHWEGPGFKDNLAGYGGGGSSYVNPIVTGPVLSFASSNAYPGEISITFS